MTEVKRPRLRRRGCLVALAVLLTAWAVVTGIIGGLVFFVDKVIHTFC